MSNHQRDALLIRLALVNRLPLITNEGYSASGLSERSDRLRARARAAGVDVRTPREYWHERIDAISACHDILWAFDREAPRFLERYEATSPVRKTFSDMRGYYEHVLFGTTATRERMTVELASAAPSSRSTAPVE